MKVTVADSQSDVLRQRLQEAGVLHGETVVVNLRGVDVRARDYEGILDFGEKGFLFFSGALLEIVSREGEGRGEGQSLPDNVHFEAGFRVPIGGRLDMLNVEIRVHKTICLTRTRDTSVEKSLG